MPSNTCSIGTSYRNYDTNAIAITIGGAFKLLGMRTLGERVRWAREQASLTQPQLAKEAKVAQARLSVLESGHAPKGTAAIVRIALACRVSAYWLETGKGPRKLGKLEATLLGLSDAEQNEWLAMIEARAKARAS